MPSQLNAIIAQARSFGSPGLRITLDAPGDGRIYAVQWIGNNRIVLGDGFDPDDIPFGDGYDITSMCE